MSDFFARIANLSAEKRILLKLLLKDGESISQQTIPQTSKNESFDTLAKKQSNKIDLNNQQSYAAASDPDPKAEAVLDPTICSENTSDQCTTNPSAIFLTGATGFLGTFLLYELLQQTQADIYCLVRSHSSEEGKQKLQKNLEFYSLWSESLSSRIIPLIGELSQPFFGLSPQQFDILAAKIDVIYHNGALVNFIYPYSALKKVNVLGTQEVLRLASRMKLKLVHHVSTLGVVASIDYPQLNSVREWSNLDYVRFPDDGYSQSKWIAEKLVTTAHYRGIPICIYRPGSISGHSKSGIWNTDDFTCRMLKGCIQLGKIPTLDKAVEMTPVDYVSKAIVYLSRQDASLGKAFHLVNPQPLHLNKLSNWISLFGYPLQQISYDEWKTELSKSAENALTPLLPFFASRTEEQMPKTIQFSSQNTLDGLAGTSIICPSVNEKLLETYFAYFIRSGFLNSPQLKDAGMKKVKARKSEG
jgi:thioester reductase-like protein